MNALFSYSIMSYWLGYFFIIVKSLGQVIVTCDPVHSEENLPEGQLASNETHTFMSATKLQMIVSPVLEQNVVCPDPPPLIAAASRPFNGVNLNFPILFCG